MARYDSNTILTSADRINEQITVLMHRQPCDQALLTSCLFGRASYQTIKVYSLLMFISLMITHFQDPTRFIFEPHLGQAACLCCIPHVIQ
jgi:hypothetical protein